MNESTLRQADRDLHADTCVNGTMFAVYEQMGQSCTVQAYSDKFKPTIVNSVHGALHMIMRMVIHTFLMLIMVWI
jgi:hypothetical protein